MMHEPETNKHKSEISDLQAWPQGSLSVCQQTHRDWGWSTKSISVVSYSHEGSRGLDSCGEGGFKSRLEAASVTLAPFLFLRPQLIINLR